MTDDGVIWNTIGPDPLSDPADGTRLEVRSIHVPPTEAGPVPAAVTNPEFFDGALLALVVHRDGQSRVVGSAVMVAPGLALTATHVFAEHLGRLEYMIAMGFRSDAVDIWDVRSVVINEDDDLAYIALSLRTPLTENWVLSTLGLTTRSPEIGESVSIYGFQFGPAREGDHGWIIEAGLLCAKGPVSEIHAPGRDKLLLPFPAIELQCGSVGGMSGGAVVDARGLLVGVVTRGWQVDDGRGPTYAAWIVGMFSRPNPVPLIWPKGFHPPGPVDPLNLDPRVFAVEGRDRIVLTPDGPRVLIWH